jgi:hypothetical protein
MRYQLLLWFLVFQPRYEPGTPAYVIYSPYSVTRTYRGTNDLLSFDTKRTAKSIKYYEAHTDSKAIACVLQTIVRDAQTGVGTEHRRICREQSDLVGLFLLLQNSERWLKMETGL